MNNKIEARPGMTYSPYYPYSIRTKPALPRTRLIARQTDRDADCF